jgi:hypothetical protein
MPSIYAGPLATYVPSNYDHNLSHLLVYMLSMHPDGLDTFRIRFGLSFRFVQIWHDHWHRRFHTRSSYGPGRQWQTPPLGHWLCLFVFISGTMRFSRHGLGASSPLITTPGDRCEVGIEPRSAKCETFKLPLCEHMQNSVSNGRHALGTARGWPRGPSHIQQSRERERHGWSLPSVRARVPLRSNKHSESVRVHALCALRAPICECTC